MSALVFCPAFSVFHLQRTGLLQAAAGNDSDDAAVTVSHIEC